MRNLYVILFCFLPVFGFSARQVHVEDDINFLDSLLAKHTDMHFYRSPTVGRADSVWHRDHFYLYFDTDSICRQFVRKGGFNAVPDEMDYLYFAVFTELTPEKKAGEIEKMEAVAKKYNSDALMREVELQKASLLSGDADEQFDHWMECMRALQHKAEKRNDTLMQIRIREGILHELRGRNRTFEALEEAVGITKMLDNISGRHYYASYGNLCFFVGETFYIHGYDEQALTLLKRALPPADFFFQRSNLCARMTLGSYYRKEGDLDLSDDYYRSILESADEVKYRGEYDAIALCGLGKNYLMRKDYQKAERLLRKGLSVMLLSEPVYSAGIYIDLGNCYLETGKLPQTKAMIDSALKYVAVYPQNVTYQTDAFTVSLYPLMSKYYAATGDITASKAYTDSTVNQYVAYQKKYNISHIFQIEKKLYEAEKATKEQQLKVEKMEKERYRNLLAAGLLMMILTIGFYVFYVRLRRRKNRVLYKRIMEESRVQTELSEAKQVILLQSSESEEGATSPPSGGLGGAAILQHLEALMQSEQLFLNPELSRKELATRLYTNENYLVNAIRDYYNGQTFSDYINSWRLKFACQQLHNNSEFSIKEVAAEAGFSSYKYFHQLFRDEFGMSPSDFRAAGR